MAATYFLVFHQEKNSGFKITYFHTLMEPSNKNKVYLGRRKIPIVKIKDKKSLIVAFSKRRKGLFKKAKEVAVLCGAEVAALAFSPAGKATILWLILFMELCSASNYIIIF